jgi:hypothetical protein
MLRRLGRSALIGIAGGLAGWLLIVILILMDSVVPWWVAAAGALILFLIEFVTFNLLGPQAEENRRERARREALAELEAQMADRGLTEG